MVNTSEQQSLRLQRAWIMNAVPALQWYGREQDLTGYAWHVDSRLCSAESIFLAIKGEHADGHMYVEDALRAGTPVVWISHSNTLVTPESILAAWPDCVVLVSPDPLVDCIALARSWRSQHTAYIVGITGSVGKTSTKELVAHMIRRAGFQVYATRDNQNTLLGGCLNLLSMPDSVQYGIFEMGISRPGEMKQMVDVIRPDTALITSVGHSHLEGLGTMDAIAAEKRQIFSYLTSGHIGMVGGDTPILADFAYVHPVIRFGKKTSNHIQARKVKVTATGIQAVLKIYQEKYPVTLSGFSLACLNNVMGALACALVLKLPIAQALAAVQEPLMVPGRFCVYRHASNGTVLIDDAYNANPESMREALRAFDRMPVNGPKVAILGDMLELGAKSPFWHRQLGRMIAKSSTIAQVILVGNEVEQAIKTLPVRVGIQHVRTWQEALDKARQAWHANSSVLIKGSHGTQLYVVARELRKEMA